MPINEQAVRERAYFIWEGEGRVHGCADIHWLRAEAELTAVQPARKPARRAAEKPAVKAEAKPVAAKPASKAKSIDSAVPPLPGRKTAKPKADAAVAAAAGKAKPARARAALH